MSKKSHNTSNSEWRERTTAYSWPELSRLYKRLGISTVLPQTTDPSKDLISGLMMEIGAAPHNIVKILRAFPDKYIAVTAPRHPRDFTESTRQSIVDAVERLIARAETSTTTDEQRTLPNSIFGCVNIIRSAIVGMMAERLGAFAMGSLEVEVWPKNKSLRPPDSMIEGMTRNYRADFGLFGDCIYDFVGDTYHFFSTNAKRFIKLYSKKRGAREEILLRYHAAADTEYVANYGTKDRWPSFGNIEDHEDLSDKIIANYLDGARVYAVALLGHLLDRGVVSVRSGQVVAMMYSVPYELTAVHNTRSTVVDKFGLNHVGPKFKPPLGIFDNQAAAFSPNHQLANLQEKDLRGNCAGVRSSIHDYNPAVATLIRIGPLFAKPIITAAMDQLSITGWPQERMGTEQSREAAKEFLHMLAVKATGKRLPLVDIQGNSFSSAVSPIPRHRERRYDEQLQDIFTAHCNVVRHYSPLREMAVSALGLSDRQFDRIIENDQKIRRMLHDSLWAAQIAGVNPEALITSEAVAVDFVNSFGDALTRRHAELKTLAYDKSRPSSNSPTLDI